MPSVKLPGEAAQAKRHEMYGARHPPWQTGTLDALASL